MVGLLSLDHKTHYTELCLHFFSHVQEMLPHSRCRWLNARLQWLHCKRTGAMCIPWCANLITGLQECNQQTIPSMCKCHHDLSQWSPRRKQKSRVSNISQYPTYQTETWAGTRLNIKVLSYQCKDFSRPSYLYNLNSYTWKDGLYIETGPSFWSEKVITSTIDF